MATPDGPKRRRQRDIVLRSLARRLIFLAGLALLALVIVLVRFGPWS
ncbi:hypothetical protein [Inquilinus sp.]